MELKSKVPTTVWNIIQLLPEYLISQFVASFAKRPLQLQTTTNPSSIQKCMYMPVRAAIFITTSYLTIGNWSYFTVDEHET